MKILALLIVFMSTVIMFWQIHEYPIRFGLGEGPCALAALKIIEGDKAEIARLLDRKGEFQRDHVGTSSTATYNPFLIFPTVLFLKTFGVDRYYVSLRAASIIYGILCVWLLYLFLGKMFNRGIGLIAAFILATSSWFIGLSRLCHDYSATICFSLLCCYFYSLADKPGNPFGYMALGGMMALSGSFYFPARVILPLFSLIILIRILFEQGYFKTYFQALLLMVFCFILVLQLQGIKVYQLFKLGHSSCEWFWVRYGFHPHDCATPWEYLLKIFKFAYNRFYVQWGWFRDPVCERDACLDPITRYILLVGVAWSLFKIKNQRYRFILIWFVGGASLTFITQTWFRRSILALPAIAALAAIGIYQTLDLLFRWLRREKVRGIILFILASAILIPIARLNLEHYFGLYRDEKLTSSLRIERERREKFLELLPKYTVYTDLFFGEDGWPQSGLFEAKRFKRETYYKPGPANVAQKDFASSSGPSALLLKSGEVKVKEAGGEVSPPEG